MYANLFVNGNGNLGRLVGTENLEVVMWVPAEADEQGKRHSRMLKVMSPWCWQPMDVVVLDKPALGHIEVVEA